MKAAFVLANSSPNREQSVAMGREPSLKIFEGLVGMSGIIIIINVVAVFCG